ncbi:MAG TPA: hypothetical protein VKT78_15735 [Fimbriimonadaceae bacterium]|nr:hypothetical protein [Fimbriimonadaceae bacterium]
MDRLRLWQVPVYALVGFIAVVWISPKTSWIPRMQLEVVSGAWHGPHSTADDTEPGWLSPQQLEPSPNDPDTDADTVLLKHIQACTRALDDSNGSAAGVFDPFKEFFTYCEQEPSPGHWAQFVRLASTQVHIPGPKERARPFGKAERESLALLIEACERGNSKEPENGFFPLVDATATYRLGQTDKALALLTIAGTCSSFDEHIEVEVDAQTNWFNRRHGYRGNQIRTWEMASVIYPHFAPISGLVKHLAQEGTASDRATAIRVGWLLMRNAKSLIGVAVGRGLIAAALGPPEKSKSGPKELGHEYPLDDALKRVRVIEAQTTGSTDLEGIARRFVGFSPQFNLPEELDMLNYIGSTPLLLGATAAVVLILMPVFLGLLWVRTRFPGVTAGCPYWVWLLAVGIPSTLGHESGLTPFLALLALLAVPAAFDTLRRRCDLFAIAASGLLLAFAWLFQVPSLVLPISLFLLSLALERRARRVAWPVTAIVFLGLLGTSAWVAVNGMDKFGFGRGLALGVPTCLAAIALIPVKPPYRWHQIVGIVCLGTGIYYGWSVFSDLKRDQALAAANVVWAHEGDEFRRAGHLQP